MIELLKSFLSTTTWKGCSCDREPSVPARGLIMHDAPSSALSSSRVSETIGLRAAVRIGRWRLALVVMRSMCSWWCVVDRRMVEGLCPQQLRLSYF